MSNPFYERGTPLDERPTRTYVLPLRCRHCDYRMEILSKESMPVCPQCHYRMTAAGKMRPVESS